MISENAEYDAAKEAQGLLEAKIAELDSQLGRARVIDLSQIDPGKAMMFANLSRTFVVERKWNIN